MKNNFGFPVRLAHRSPVKGAHSMSTGYRLSVECNRPDSPCDIATTIRQSASVWSSAAALMKGLINSSWWQLLIVIGQFRLIACAQTNYSVRSEIARMLLLRYETFSANRLLKRNANFLSIFVTGTAKLSFHHTRFIITTVNKLFKQSINTMIKNWNND